MCESPCPLPTDNPVAQDPAEDSATGNLLVVRNHNRHRRVCHDLALEEFQGVVLGELIVVSHQNNIFPPGQINRGPKVCVVPQALGLKPISERQVLCF